MKKLQFRMGLIVTILLAFTSISQPLFSQTGGLLVSSFFAQLNETIKKLEQSGHSLMDHGNVVLGQQQVLLAGTLRSTIEQAQSAYKDSLNKTFDQVDVQRQNIFRDLQHLVDQADEIKGQTVQDAQRLIYSTAGQANVLLERLPFVKRNPVYFGAVSKNILSELNQSAIDLELLGFYLSDPKLPSYPPQVTINGTVIPAEYISAKFDRIQVLFPEHERAMLRLSNNPCDPMRSFTVKLRVFRSNYPRLAKLSSWFVSSADFQEFVSPGKPLYEVIVRLDGKNVQNKPVDNSYDVHSGLQNWSCEQRVDSSATFTAPEAGAQILTANAEWIDMGGRWENKGANATYNGATATASGWVVGGNKEGVHTPLGDVKNCPGGGHGMLRIYGTYRHLAHTEELFSFTNIAAFGNDASVATPIADGLQIAKVNIQIRRKGCASVIDEMDFPVGDLPNRGVDQTSKKGYFKAQYEKGQIVVKGTPSIQ